ncbi:unnamed protein product [Urochloa humidicola]
MTNHLSWWPTTNHGLLLLRLVGDLLPDQSSGHTRHQIPISQGLHCMNWESGASYSSKDRTVLGSPGEVDAGDAVSGALAQARQLEPAPDAVAGSSSDTSGPPGRPVNVQWEV